MATEKCTTENQIALRYQRMKAALEQCLHDGRNRLCLETHHLVGDLLADLDESLL